MGRRSSLTFVGSAAAVPVGEPFTGVAAEPPADGKLVVGVPGPPPTGAAAGADVGALAGGVGDVVPGGLAPGAVAPGATATT